MKIAVMQLNSLQVFLRALKEKSIQSMSIYIKTV